jgi:signal peptidase I
VSDREGWSWDDERERTSPRSYDPAPLEPEPAGNLGLAALVGLVAALAGGLAWGLIVKWTEYEVGFVAWGIGFLTAAAVLRAAGGRKSGALQVVAVVSALLGVLLGKYLGFAWTVQEELGVAAGVLSGEMLSLFRENLSQIFGRFDLLWIGLAVASAWISLQADDAPPARDAPPAPARRSRNPVDRLTQGLPHRLRVTVDWIVTIAPAIVLAIKAWVVNPYRIPSSSMETTLHCARPTDGCEARFSDRVLANRLLYRFRDPERGEIIVFKTPPAAARCGGGGTTFVKRLVGLPGERLELRTEGGLSWVYINGKKLQEPYVGPDRRDARGPETFRIPAGHYFMMGDNRTHSCDSREWGTVPRDNLIGKVFATYWPPNRISFR